MRTNRQIFGMDVELPDMLYGISAWWILWVQLFSCRHDNPETCLTQHPSFLLYWHLIGFVIIVPTGVGIVQLGMAPTALYSSQAPYRLLFEYPMVLGPAVVVPILIAWNLLAVMHQIM